MRGLRHPGILRTLAIAAFIAFARGAHAIDEGVTDIYQPFTIESARAAGMGRVVSVAGDGSIATWWSPAALAWDPKRRVALSSGDYAAFFLDGDYIRSATVSGPLSQNAGSIAIGIGFKRLDRGAFEVIGPDGAPIGTSESFDHHFIASVGVPLGARWSAGASIEYLWSHLADPIPELSVFDGSGGAFSASLGAAYQHPMIFAPASGESGQLVLTPLGAASILHLGQKVEYEDDDGGEDLARQFRAGIGVKAAFTPEDGTPVFDRSRWKQFAFATALETHIPIVDLDAITQETITLQYGAELSYLGVLTGRVGFIDDDASGFVSRDNTYGVGLSLPDGLPFDVSFDWASVPFAGSERVERRSLVVTLGRGGGL
jgi:hypothetical protein